MKKPYLIPSVLVLFFVLVGCGGETFANNSNKDTTGNELYIPDGYQAQLDKMDLEEIVAKPYFHSPFITIAQDSNGIQYAVIFSENGEIRKEKLPIKYEEIVDKLVAKGIIDPSSNSKAENNLHLFIINNKLVWSWSYDNLYFDLTGNEVNDPFNQNH